MATLAGMARSQLFHGQPTTTKPYRVRTAAVDRATPTPLLPY